MKSIFIEEAVDKSGNQESEINMGITVEAFRMMAWDEGKRQRAVDRIVASYVPIDFGVAPDAKSKLSGHLPYALI